MEEDKFDDSGEDLGEILEDIWGVQYPNLVISGHEFKYETTAPHAVYYTCKLCEISVCIEKGDEPDFSSLDETIDDCHMRVTAKIMLD